MRANAPNSISIYHRLCISISRLIEMHMLQEVGRQTFLHNIHNFFANICISFLYVAILKGNIIVCYIYHNMYRITSKTKRHCYNDFVEYMRDERRIKEELNPMFS